MTVRRLSSGAAALGCAAVLIALTQLPFWLMQSRVAIQRPLLDLDYFVAILILLRWPRLGVASLVLAWLVEINLDASVSYNFVGAADLLDAVRFADLVKLDHVLSWKLLLVALAVVLCMVALMRVAASARARGRTSAVTFWVVAVGLAAFALDAVNGSNQSLGLERDRFLVDTNVAGSPSVVTLKGLRTAWNNSAQPMARSPEPISFDHAVAWHDAHPHGSVLLVLVESMGLPSSAPLRDWLGARLDAPDLQGRWHVERTAERFRGSTVYDELRVLCGLQGHYSRLKPEDEPTCLPQRFLRSGDEALGLHGFSLRMFDRQRWWRDLGLTPQDFRREAEIPADVHCNEAFPGVCDGPVLDRATALADAPGRLVYVVTLDTHLPLSARAQPLPADLAALCEGERTTENACRMVARLGAVLDRLHADLVTMRHPPLVLVSGDHAPPFLEMDTRAAFDPLHVQGFVLTPTADGP